MWNLGENLIHDDKGDLGYFNYRGRRSHRYHGVSSPDHPSALHHWQAGVVLVLGAIGLTLSNLVNDAREMMDEEETLNSSLIE